MRQLLPSSAEQAHPEFTRQTCSHALTDAATRNVPASEVSTLQNVPPPMPTLPETEMQTPPAVLDGVSPFLPPDAQPPEPHANPEAPANLDEPQQPGSIVRLARKLGVDRAVGFTVLARGWASLAGIATLGLIAYGLSPQEQGFYYTFYSLVALQIVFELGFSVVILQTASHEAAHLHIAADGVITGAEEAHSRLASVFQKSMRWYTAAAVLLACVVPFAGYVYFQHNAVKAVQGVPIHWVLPWLCVIFASCFTFQIDPVFSFLEGCGFVPQVARTRLTQAITGTILGWAALLTHHGLFAPACMISGQALAGAYFIFTKRRMLLGLYKHKAERFKIDWGSEIWPFQWRIAVSWACGYFIFQLFNPILFKCRNAAEAGQMGMTVSVCGTLSAMAVSWMNTKAAPFGRMIALREFAQLDRTFFRALFQSTLAALIACAGVWTILLYLRHSGVHLAYRLLPPVPLAMMFLATIANIIVFAEALYLRAHKQEKFVTNSLLTALYTAPAAFLVGRSMSPYGGAWGISAVYLAGTLTIGLGFGTYTFLKWRRIWHA